MFTLSLEKRDQPGKGLETARVSGKLPVVIYGPKEPSASFFANTVQFKKVYGAAGESSIITLQVDGDEKDALIHDVSAHPVTGEPIHADFYVIEKGKKIQVKVPLEFIGVAPAFWLR